MSDLLDKRVDKLLAKLRKNDDDCAHLPLLDESYELLEALQAANDRYSEALTKIVRGEEEAPLGMSNPAAIARDALIRTQTYSREVTP